MRNAILIENIEELRRECGIEDSELRLAIRELRVGDTVRLTLLPDTTPFAGEVVDVRITRIDGPRFRGKLITGPSLPRLADIQAGTFIAFSNRQIHSLPKGTVSHDE